AYPFGAPKASRPGPVHFIVKPPPVRGRRRILFQFPIIRSWGTHGAAAGARRPLPPRTRTFQNPVASGKERRDEERPDGVIGRGAAGLRVGLPPQRPQR